MKPVNPFHLAELAWIYASAGLSAGRLRAQRVWARSLSDRPMSILSPLYFAIWVGAVGSALGRAAQAAPSPPQTLSQLLALVSGDEIALMLAPLAALALHRAHSYFWIKRGRAQAESVIQSLTERESLVLARREAAILESSIKRGSRSKKTSKPPRL